MAEANVVKANNCEWILGVLCDFCILFGIGRDWLVCTKTRQSGLRTWQPYKGPGPSQEHSVALAAIGEGQHTQEEGPKSVPGGQVCRDPEVCSTLLSGCTSFWVLVG